MARRKNRNKNDNILVMLMELPWQVSVVVAVIIFSVMRWFIPMQAKGPVLIPLANAISGYAPFVAILFLLIGVISYFRNRQSNSPELEKNVVLPFRRKAETSAPSAEVGFIPASTKPNHDDSEWTIELLQRLEWKRFELLCAEYFKLLGKRVETIPHGADGGIDARVYKKDSDVVESFIQCKSWSKIVGVAPVRELYGVMAHESTGKGILMTTSTFSDDAREFAKAHSNKLFLIDGAKFVSMLLLLAEDKQRLLLDFATDGDYTTPSCASCGIKMVRRSGKVGKFWGCHNYPKCQSMLKMSQQ